MRRKSEIGLTLLELLICISIVALTSAISFSVYKRSMLKAKETTCIQQQRQISAAIVQFRSDYNEAWPGDHVYGLRDLRAWGYLRDERLCRCPSEFWKTGVALVADSPQPRARFSISYFHVIGHPAVVSYAERRSIEFAYTACILHGDKTREYGRRTKNPEDAAPQNMVSGKVVAIMSDLSLRVNFPPRFYQSQEVSGRVVAFNLYEIIFGRKVSDKEIEQAREECYGY